MLMEKVCVVVWVHDEETAAGDGGEGKRLRLCSWGKRRLVLGLEL